MRTTVRVQARCELCSNGMERKERVSENRREPQPVAGGSSSDDARLVNSRALQRTKQRRHRKLETQGKGSSHPCTFARGKQMER
eukprot:5023396-Pleurochrysis_carterae.AAC.1